MSERVMGTTPGTARVEPEPGPLVEVAGLTKVFGPHQPEALALLADGASKRDILNRTGATVALADVNLRMTRGDTFVVMGLSGSGKSTLVRCINRLLEPNSGRVIVDGSEVTALDQRHLRVLRRSKFGMVFQSFALLPHRTVLENVAFGLELQGVDRRGRHGAAAEAVALVGLDGYEGAYPDQLSGGMAQRVGLARALAHDPDVLLMDEPFSALDPLTRTQMQDELLDLQSRLHKTIVFITHDLDEAIKLGNRIAIMADGRISQVGSAAEILSNPANEYVASFVRGVDRTTMLTAADVMVRPDDMLRLGHSPAAALRVLEHAGRSSAFVVDREGRLAGVASADAVSAALSFGAPDLAETVDADVQSCAPDTPLSNLYSSAAAQRMPVAVVDDSRHLIGLVNRVSILRGLAEAQPEAVEEL
jgi:glycine betaine/proline transport system ATP-binding protein